MDIVKFIKGGGVMMYPLIFCSIVLIAIIIERAISLRKAAGDGDELLEQLKTVTHNDPTRETAKALALCQAANNPIGRLFVRGLKNLNRGADAMEMAMEQEAANEMPAIEANLPIIRTIVNIAPLLGLLGTIAGMIGSFRAASERGLSNPTAILGGISEALISTATGITLAVIGFVAYNYFANLSRKLVEDMEFYGAEFINYMTGRLD